MKKIILITSLIFIFNTNAKSEEIVDCRDHKISPNAVICEAKKIGNNVKKKLTRKQDGSLNFLGRWFKAKTIKDLSK